MTSQPPTDPSSTTFRSFWQTPSTSSNTTRPDEYQGIPIASTEATPLIPSSSQPPITPSSKRRSYLTYCCLLLLLLLLLIAIWWWFAAVPIAAVSHSNVTTLCNPFSFDPKPSVDLKGGYGIVATIRYISDPLEQSRASNTRDYEHGQLMNQTFFLSALDVPTRVFTDQFVDHSGHHLPSEFFGMTGETRIGLSDIDDLGNYQFALLSDDGSIMTITENNRPHVLIDNDGVHTTRLSVAKTNVTFHDRHTKYDVKIQWFQGPPAHIALQLLWRKSPASLTEPLDGVFGNDVWYNWHIIPSIPTSQYNTLLSHGWKPVKAHNFYLPERFPQQAALQMQLNAGIDPCLQEY